MCSISAQACLSTTFHMTFQAKLTSGLQGYACIALLTCCHLKKEKSTPLGIMTGAFVPRSSPTLVTSASLGMQSCAAALPICLVYNIVSSKSKVLKVHVMRLVYNSAAMLREMIPTDIEIWPDFHAHWMP